MVLYFACRKKLALSLFLLTAGSEMARGTECAELFAMQTNREAQPSLEDFAKNLGESGKISNAELLRFLESSGVIMEKQDGQLPNETMIVSTRGEHPLNRLARIYGDDGVRIGFSFELLDELGARGLYSFKDKLVIFDSVGSPDRTKSRFLTITDFHELLHARLAKKSSGTYVSSKLMNGSRLEPKLQSTGYGDRISFSEFVTHRHDYRLSLGKVSFWLKEERQSTKAAEKTWITYVWPSKSPKESDRMSVESVESLISRSEEQLDTIAVFNETAASVIKVYDESLSRLLGNPEPPQDLYLGQSQVGNQTVNSLVYAFKVIHEGGAFSMASLEFSVGAKEGRVDWDIARKDVADQIANLRKLTSSSQPLLDRARGELAHLREAWALWTNTGERFSELRAAAIQAHETSKLLHQLSLNGI